MRIIFLGTAGYHPSETRHTSCIMLPEQGLVLDAGTGMFRVRDHLCTSELDVIVSHAHLDHVIGLTYLLDVLYEKPMQRVTVYADQQKLAAIRTCMLSEFLFPAPLPCDFLSLAEAVPIRGGGKLSSFPLDHPGGSLGFRLDWPQRSLAYITDTTASADAPYVHLIRGVDVLIHECNFPDELADLGRTTGHSWTSSVAHVARTAMVGRLILTHINPLLPQPDPIGLDTARHIFAKTELATDGMVVEF